MTRPSLRRIAPQRARTSALVVLLSLVMLPVLHVAMRGHPHHLRFVNAVAAASGPVIEAAAGASASHVSGPCAICLALAQNRGFAAVGLASRVPSDPPAPGPLAIAPAPIQPHALAILASAPRAPPLRLS